MVQQSINLDDQVFLADNPALNAGCANCGSGKAGESGDACGNGLEKIYPTTAVRFGYMRYIGEFTHPPGMKFTCGARVVIQTRRGIEIGEQVSLSCSGCSKAVSRDKIKSWVQTCGRDAFIFDGGRILRESTAADLADYARIQETSKEKRQFCQATADRLKLQLRIVECECPFGGERIVFLESSLNILI
jgi:cell fate regulator YaaT (PSP1 superfamily)